MAPGGKSLQQFYDLTCKKNCYLQNWVIWCLLLHLSEGCLSSNGNPPKFSNVQEKVPDILLHIVVAVLCSLGLLMMPICHTLRCEGSFSLFDHGDFNVITLKHGETTMKNFR
jgi:hypothetical protein